MANGERERGRVEESREIRELMTDDESLILTEVPTRTHSVDPLVNATGVAACCGVGFDFWVSKYLLRYSIPCATEISITE